MFTQVKVLIEPKEIWIVTIINLLQKQKQQHNVISCTFLPSTTRETHFVNKYNKLPLTLHPWTNTVNIRSNITDNLDIYTVVFA